MWVGAEDSNAFPNFDPAMSKRAFQETMMYYSKKPRSSDIKTDGLFVMTLRDDDSREWAQTTDLIDIDQVYDVLTDLILDPDAGTYVREQAVKAIRGYCTDEMYEQLGKKLDGLTDSSADSIRKAYNDAK